MFFDTWEAAFFSQNDFINACEKSAVFSVIISTKILFFLLIAMKNGQIDIINFLKSL